MSIPKFSQSCVTLRALLASHKGTVQGIDGVSVDEQLFLTSTCATEVLLHSIAIIASADYEVAVGGLRAIEMEQRLGEICAEMNALYDEAG